LFRRFAGTEDHFRESFPQRPVQIHLGEGEFRDRRGLKPSENNIEFHRTAAEIFQKFSPFLGRHGAILPGE
jgi:hypothetical protein